jgi:hypothetical protein
MKAIRVGEKKLSWILGLAVSALFATILLTPSSSAYSYSMTIIEDYSWMDDLTPWGTQFADIVDTKLSNDGWTKEFYHKDSEVTKEDFGTSNYGYEGLDETDFHWHFGHGLSINYDLALWDYSPWNLWATVGSNDVDDKWDYNNEWVVFQACHVLRDNNWGAALKYSHMVLGYSTATYSDPTVADRFFYYAIDTNDAIYPSWWLATKYTYDSDVKAKVIADTEDQLYHDHLHNHGYVALDEYPDDSSVWIQEWDC